MKKFFVLLLSAVMLFTNISFADSSLVQNYISEDVFKFSDKKEEKLPYVAFSMDRMIVDRDINKMGIMISGNNIEVNNSIKKSQVIIGSDTVRINGYVESAIIFAPKIIINGNINNLIAFTENMNITKSGNINEDLMIISEKLNIDGNVNGSVIGLIKNIIINGNLKNDLRVYVDKLNIDNANINGKVLVKSYNDIVIPSKFINNDFIKLEKVENKININYISIIISYVFVVLLYNLINNRNNCIDNMIAKFDINVDRIILLGTLTLLTFPLIFILSLYIMVFKVSVIPTVILSIYLAIIVLGFTLSTFFISLLITNKISTKLSINNLYKGIILVGISVLISLIYYIPFVGGILFMIFAIISIGIILVNLFNLKRSE